MPPFSQSPHLEPLKEDTLAGTYKSVSLSADYGNESSEAHQVNDALCLPPLRPEYTSGPETDVGEGEGCGAVPASSQNLHRGHVQPAKQPAVRPPVGLWVSPPASPFPPLPPNDV